MTKLEKMDAVMRWEHRDAAWPRRVVRSETRELSPAAAEALLHADDRITAEQPDSIVDALRIAAETR